MGSLETDARHPCVSTLPLPLHRTVPVSQLPARRPCNRQPHRQNTSRSTRLQCPSGELLSLGRRPCRVPRTGQARSRPPLKTALSPGQPDQTASDTSASLCLLPPSLYSPSRRVLLGNGRIVPPKPVILAAARRAIELRTAAETRTKQIRAARVFALSEAIREELRELVWRQGSARRARTPSFERLLRFEVASQLLELALIRHGFDWRGTRDRHNRRRGWRTVGV